MLYQYYNEQKKHIKMDMVYHFNKTVILKEIDKLWQDHLSSMENLRQTIHLRGYAQQDPKQEYKREGFELFQKLMYEIKRNVVSSVISMSNNNNSFTDNIYEDLNYSNMKFEMEEKRNLIIHDLKKKLHNLNDININKIGRNELCLCGSGKKFKQCHGKI